MNILGVPPDFWPTEVDTIPGLTFLGSWGELLGVGITHFVHGAVDPVETGRARHSMKWIIYIYNSEGAWHKRGWCFWNHQMPWFIIMLLITIAILGVYWHSLFCCRPQIGMVQVTETCHQSLFGILIPVGQTAEIHCFGGPPTQCSSVFDATEPTMQRFDLKSLKLSHPVASPNSPQGSRVIHTWSLSFSAPSTFTGMSRIGMWQPRSSSSEHEHLNHQSNLGKTDFKARFYNSVPQFCWSLFI